QTYVLQEPVAPLVVGWIVRSNAAVVVAAVLQVNPQRLLFAFADNGRVRIAATEVHETADQAEHLSKLVRTFPRDGEGRDRSRARAADPTPLGISGDVEFPVQRGHQLIPDHARVLVVERVVLGLRV